MSERMWGFYLPVEKLIEGIDKSWFGNYTPTYAAQAISRQRIAERLEVKDEHSKTN